MKTAIAALYAALYAALLAAPAASQTVPPWEKIKLSEFVQSVKFGGDLRLRYDRSTKRGAGQFNRGRGRFRLRLGVEAQLPNDLLVATRLATGTGEQVSTNQSADNLSSQKAIFIDQAYAKWSPTWHDSLTVSAQAGRMPNNLWRIYSSDIVWDDDFNPEGLSQHAEWLLPEWGLTVFGNAMQAVADEDSGAQKNQYVFSQQLGLEARLPLESRLRLAVAYHKWSDEQRSSLGATVANDGNRRTANSTAGILLNRFGVGELTAQLSSWIGQTPLALQVTAIRNFRARGDLAGVAGACPATTNCTASRDGYQYGLIVGKASAAKTWEAAYFKKWSQTDSTVADVADSDFGDGGTNRQGHIFWVAYSPTVWAQLKVKHFDTQTLDTLYAPGDKGITRTQFDFSIKF